MKTTWKIILTGMQSLLIYVMLLIIVPFVFLVFGDTPGSNTFHLLGSDIMLISTKDNGFVAEGTLFGVLLFFGVAAFIHAMHLLLKRDTSWKVNE